MIGLIALSVFYFMKQTTTLTTLTFVIGLLPDKWIIKKKLNNHASKFSFRLLSRAFSAIVTYHQIENKPRMNGICVANHTSPIDVVLLACDTSYALVGFCSNSLLLSHVASLCFQLIPRSLARILQIK